MDHDDLTFKSLNNDELDQAVCRNHEKQPALFVVSPGDALAMSFRPECNSETESGKTVQVMSEGKTIERQSGDWENGPRHGGGNCQVSISYNESPAWSDFVVIHQWKGTCPDSKKEYTFSLPDTLPSGNVIIQWTWFSAWGLSHSYRTA